ncbi:MLO-like protein 12 isoform X2 [Camellia sinensis]|uniref:MLO-like protein 12 isoform X2 n=1 Tax=Camellia sinensis TaxID=4442 RepID=UPI0010362DD9|nr:MLO-like protein 12 isoform X2 [Camellia sinensis]
MSGEAGLRSLEDTPTWAVATICFVLISSSLLIEYVLLLLSKYFNKKRRKSLFQALDKIKSELIMLGFISLLLTISERQIAKICIPKSVGETFLPCQRITSDGEEATKCAEQGKLSLLSRTGVRQLQFLIFVLALFHVFSCFLTFSLGMAKMKRWKSWEAQTRTLEYQFSNDPRRIQLTHQTSFGRQHLQFWSEHRYLRLLACFFRQFYKSVSEVDYFTLRHGFIMAHFAEGSHFDFQKYLKRVLEKDFGVVVGISFWIWIFSVVFIFLNAHVFYSYFWLPFIPLVMLLIVGTKLQAIITRMCLDTNDKSLIVLGTLLVRPSDHYFWFERPKLLLHLMHFILFQNSFQLAFFTWTWMGTSMKKVVLTEEMVKGLKRWRAKAKKNLARRNTSSTLHSLDASITSLDTSPSFNTLHRSPSVDLDNLSIDGDFVAVEVKNEDNVAGKRVEHHQKFGSFRGFDLREAL